MGLNAKATAAEDPEWRALLLAAGGLELEPDARTTFDALVTDATFRWGELISQAIQHKLVPAVGTAMKRLRTRDVGLQIRRFWVEMVNVNLHKLNVQNRHVREISAALDAAGVRFAFTKGVSFQGTIYAEGERWINDVDIMIPPEHCEEAAATLRSLGYIAGRYDASSSLIRAHSRKEILLHQLSHDHLPLHSRLTGDLVHPVIAVDIANSLLWTGSGYRLETAEALTGLDLVVLSDGTAAVPRMAPAYQFLFTILHLFREAWFQRWDYRVTLMGFGDVIRLWRAHAAEYRKEAFGNLLDRLGLAKPVTWVLTHMDAVFGSNVVPELRLPELDEDFLYGAFGRAQDEQKRWLGTMKERLRSPVGPGWNTQVAGGRR